MLEIIIIEKQPHKAGPQWKFAGSFYYALVVLSLIGYGHSTPKTLLGTVYTVWSVNDGLTGNLPETSAAGFRRTTRYIRTVKHLAFGIIFNSSHAS